MGEYHVFLSHASEDKETFARPLYERLIDENYRVWYDEREIEWGDKLDRKITEGLKKSQYGMVVISPNYFAKHKEWTFMEFNNILESDKILLILHGMKLLQIQRNHPKEYERIKNWVGISSDEGIEYIVQQTQRKLGFPIKKFEFQAAKISTSLLSIVTRNTPLNYFSKSAEYFTQNLRNGVTLEMVSIPGGLLS